MIDFATFSRYVNIWYLLGSSDLDRRNDRLAIYLRSLVGSRLNPPSSQYFPRGVLRMTLGAARSLAPVLFRGSTPDPLDEFYENRYFSTATSRLVRTTLLERWQAGSLYLSEVDERRHMELGALGVLANVPIPYHGVVLAVRDQRQIWIAITNEKELLGQGREKLT